MTSTDETMVEPKVDEPPSEIQQLKDAVRGLLKGEVLTSETIYQLLGVLNEAEPDPEGEAPSVKQVARAGTDGHLHVFEWNPKTGLYDKDLGLAAATPAS